MDAPTHLTFGIAATRIGGGCQVHHLQRLAKRGLIPHSSAGRFRLVAVKDMPAVRAACAKAGYLRAEPEAAGAV